MMILTMLFSQKNIHNVKSYRKNKNFQQKLLHPNSAELGCKKLIFGICMKSSPRFVVFIYMSIFYDFKLTKHCKNHKKLVIFYYMM